MRQQEDQHDRFNPVTAHESCGVVERCGGLFKWAAKKHSEHIHPLSTANAESDGQQKMSRGVFDDGRHRVTRRSPAWGSSGSRTDGNDPRGNARCKHQADASPLGSPPSHFPPSERVLSVFGDLANSSSAVILTVP